MSRLGPNSERVRLASIHGTARRLCEHGVAIEGAIAELVDVAAEHPRRTKLAAARYGPAPVVPRPDLLSSVAGQYAAEVEAVIAREGSDRMHREASLWLLVAAAEACGGLDLHLYESGRRSVVG